MYSTDSVGFYLVYRYYERYENLIYTINDDSLKFSNANKYTKVFILKCAILFFPKFSLTGITMTMRITTVPGGELVLSNALYVFEGFNILGL